MSIVELITRLRQQNIRIWVQDNQLAYAAPKGGFPKSLRDELVAHKSEVIEFMTSACEDKRLKYPLTPVSRDTNLPLSSAQQRLWLLDQTQPDTALYNIVAAVVLNGPLDVTALHKAFAVVVERHEALRTVFPAPDGQPFQKILPTIPVPFSLIDLSALPELIRDMEITWQQNAAAARPFNLATGPLVRFTVLALQPTAHAILLTLHHIIADGWSIKVALNEISTIYQSLAGNRSIPLPPLKIQYADFACWEEQFFEDKALQSQLAYWRSRLADIPDTLNLPRDYRRTASTRPIGGAVPIEFSPTLTRQFTEFAQEQNSTLFMLLLAVFNVLLWRNCAQEDICIGMPIATRHMPELEHMIGLFVNTLVLRTRVTGEDTFVDLLAQVRQNTLEAYNNQDAPFDKVVKLIRSRHSSARTPLFTVAISLDNAPAANLESAGLTLESLPVHTSASQFDIALYFGKSSETVNGTWVYDARLFEKKTIRSLQQEYIGIFENVLSKPNIPLSTLPLTSCTAELKNKSTREKRNTTLKNKLLETAKKSV